MKVTTGSGMKPNGFGLIPEPERRDFSEIREDRYQVRSTILTEQLAVARWHEQIGDSTLAYGVLDRLVHNAYRIEMPPPFASLRVVSS